MSIFAQCQIAWVMVLEMLKETFNGRGVEFRTEKEVVDVGCGNRTHPVGYIGGGGGANNVHTNYGGGAGVAAGNSLFGGVGGYIAQDSTLTENSARNHREPPDHAFHGKL